MNDHATFQSLQFTNLSPDEKLERVAQLLTQSEVTADELRAACRILSAAARTTWWQCGCGEIPPNAGDIDIFCTKCGQIRQLPNRLSRSPWPLYIECLKRLKPDFWFEELAEWMRHEKLGECISDEYADNALSAAQVGVLPAAIADEGSRVLPQAIAARGAMPPVQKKHIRCIDGMILDNSGDVRGLQWIALPMMPVL